MQDKTPLEVSASGPVGGRLENSSARRLIKLAAVGVVLSGSIMVHHSTSATTAPQSNSKNPMPAIEKNIALGLNHFDAHCAGCHGTSGKADTEKGRTVSAADLTSEAVQSKSDAELFRTISNGVPGTAMPAFARTHKAAEIWQTVLFLRKLPTLTPEEKEKLERAVPAGARHRHGAEQEHQHPDAEDSEGKTHHQHPAKEASKPSSTQQSPSTEQQHQHEPPQSQKSQEMARPAHTHETHRSAEQPVPTQPHEEHRHDAHPATGQTSEVKQGVSKTENEHSGHEMPEAHGAHNMDAMLSTITGGPFSSMTAIGSGTSLMPASSPGYMFHWMKGAWMIMAHGDLKAGFNHQGGPRGVNKAESQNWFMLMAERKAGPGQLILRGMFSAEPATAPRRGFPELFQTGETFKGRPIIDAQHPHDLFMELAVAYNIRLSEHVALNFYGGPVAEPALGPVAFMHRVSASENPAAPLGHHWQDSTHISHGVLTAGVTAWRFRVETSLFRGAEPDENRKDIKLGKLDFCSGPL